MVWAMQLPVRNTSRASPCIFSLEKICKYFLSVHRPWWAQKTCEIPRRSVLNAPRNLLQMLRELRSFQVPGIGCSDRCKCLMEICHGCLQIPCWGHSRKLVGGTSWNLRIIWKSWCELSKHSGCSKRFLICLNLNNCLRITEKGFASYQGPQKKNILRRKGNSLERAIVNKYINGGEHQGMCIPYIFADEIR